MKEWSVRLTGVAYEYYIVEAETEQEAIDSWATGILEDNERSSMEVVDAVLVHDDEG